MCFLCLPCEHSQRGDSGMNLDTIKLKYAGKQTLWNTCMHVSVSLECQKIIWTAGQYDQSLLLVYCLWMNYSWWSYLSRTKSDYFPPWWNEKFVTHANTTGAYLMITYWKHNVLHLLLIFTTWGVSYTQQEPWTQSVGWYSSVYRQRILQG